MGSVSLRKGLFSIVFHDRFPIIMRFRAAGAVIEGDGMAEEPAVTVFSPEHGRNELSPDAGLRSVYRMRKRPGAVEYAVSLESAGSPVVRFELAYRADDAGIALSMSAVEEKDGYQLVHVDLKHLVSASTADPRSRLILPTHGGRRIDPSRYESYRRMLESLRKPD